MTVDNNIILIIKNTELRLFSVPGDDIFLKRKGFV